MIKFKKNQILCFIFIQLMKQEKKLFSRTIKLCSSNVWMEIQCIMIYNVEGVERVNHKRIIILRGGGGARGEVR